LRRRKSSLTYEDIHGEVSDDLSDITDPERALYGDPLSCDEEGQVDDRFDYPELDYPSSDDQDAQAPADPRLAHRDVPEDSTPPTPVASKRTRSNSIESNYGPIRKAVRIDSGEGRVKAHSYDVEEQSVLSVAIKEYVVKLSDKNPFPEPKEEADWAKAAWKEGCRVKETNIKHDPTILKLVSFHISA
jgi:hypothetical protein